MAHDPELAARFRAAFAYAGMEPKDIAAVLGVSVRTVHRLRSGGTAIDRDLRERLPELTGAPAWFVEYGFDPTKATDDPRLAEKVEALDGQMQTVLRILTGRVGAELGAGAAPPGDHEDREGGEAEGPTG